MEIMFKLIITFLAIFLLIWLWSSHIDPVRSVKNFFISKFDWIEQREVNGIYQDGNLVGKVKVDVEIVDDKYVFGEITDTLQLDINKPFEYGREKYQIVNIGKMIGLSSDGRQGILFNVSCERVI